MNINNKKLENVYFYLKTLGNITLSETTKVNGNPSSLDKIVPVEIQGKYSKEKKSAAQFIDGVNQVYYEMSVIYLVAEFEQVLFKKFDNSYGEIKKIVKDNKTAKGIDFYKSREDLASFIKQ